MAPALRSRSVVWTVSAFLLAAPLVATLAVTMWRSPYPISETVALLEGAGVLEVTAAPPFSWSDPTLRAMFDPAARSWYRPLYHFTWYTLWKATTSLTDTLFAFKILEVGSVVVLVALLLLHVRPSSALECGAALLATAVLVGAPGLRQNLEQPLLNTLIAMPIALGVWMLLEGPRRWWIGPMAILLTSIAVGYKEQGLVLVPVILLAWWNGSPGAGRWTAITAGVLAVTYVAFRLITRGAWGAFEQDIGFGFSTLSAADASARFGDAPYWMYLYNVLCTVANVLLSEPTSGSFTVIESLVRGTVAPWQINHLLSSAVLTVLIGWWGVTVLQERAHRQWTAEARLFVVFVGTLLASGALGFNYTRDRLGGMVLVFYALSSYYAVRGAATAIRRSSGPRTVVTAAFLLALACAWQLRAIGTIDGEHLRAARVSREWMTNLQRRRLEFAGSPVYVQILNAMARQGVDTSTTPSTTSYPRDFGRFLGDR